MVILAIDPGQHESGFVEYDTDLCKILDLGIPKNEEMLQKIIACGRKPAVEYPSPRGQPMYTQIVDTIAWIGRFIQVTPTKSIYKIDRKDVKMILCGNTKASDSNVNAAIMSCFPETGGGARGQIGTKDQPGPLYGVKKHIWPALGVMIVHSIKNGVPPTPFHKKHVFKNINGSIVLPNKIEDLPF